MNILYLYNSSQTYTNTVFEHLTALSSYSRHKAFFMPVDQIKKESIVDFSKFDAVCVHYTIRLPFDQLPPVVAEALRNYSGLKFIFIQDEYDHTHRTWHWIKTLGIQLMFTVVPDAGIARVYPPEEFPGTRFVSNLTGYVPVNLATGNDVIPPSRRSIVVGYRGRSLPVRYGALGFEKVEIGRMVRAYCESRGIASDIAWTEDARIYGAAWDRFMASCRAMLGSESGSNVFNWDGQLQSELDEFKKERPEATEAEIYEKVIKPKEADGLMNQVSPRVFEAVAAKTVLVLYEGSYSGVVKPDEHYIPLKKDGSNLDDVFEKLNDGAYVDQMADRAYEHVIGSGEFSYLSFVRMVDTELDRSLRDLALLGEKGSVDNNAGLVVNGNSLVPVSVFPKRASTAPIKEGMRVELQSGRLIIDIPVYAMWNRTPAVIRRPFHPVLKAIKHKFVYKR